MTPHDPPAWTRTADGADTVLTLPRSGPAEGAGAVVFLWAVGVALLISIPVGPFAAFAGFPAAGVFLIPWLGGYLFLTLIAALGLWVAAARDCVRVGGGQLEYARGVGPLWKRSVRLDVADVRRFVVSGASSRTGANNSGMWGELSVLEVEDVTGRRRRMGLWYRRDVLLPFAAELAALCGLPSELGVVDDPNDEFHPTLPPGSTLRLRPQPEGIVVAVGPLGSRGLDRYFWGCSVFAPVLFLMLALIGVFTLQGAVKWDPAPPPPWVVVGVMIGGGSAAVLLLLLLGFFRLVTTYGRSEVRVSRAGLEVEEPGVFRPMRWSWPGERVAAVIAEFDPKDQSRSLVVVGHDGSREGVLGHLSLEELQWLAARVRESL
ncbi:MAG: hypothetical protein U0804_07360 [Gemmataceae bacterium]